MSFELDPLSELSAFAFGAAGALLGLAIILVLPAAVTLAKGGQPPTITPWRLIGVLTVVAIYLAAGGAAAWLIGDATRARDAFAYGLAWEGIIGGAILTGKAMLPKTA